MEEFIRCLPKAELHMHLEGSIEPQLMFDLARRNGVTLKWDTPEAIRQAYHFEDLQSFLDLFYAGCNVLVTERDFYDMTVAYLRRAHADNVLHAELMLSLPIYVLRGIPAEVVMNGVYRAIDDVGTELAISASVIIMMQRHRTEAETIKLLDFAMPWSIRIAAIGLGGAEVGNPPSKFARFFVICKERGFRITVHAGEEGPAAYVREAFDLGVDRIDHGNACLDDAALVSDLIAAKMPLTVCPVSNLKLKVVKDLKTHPLKRLIDAGLVVTINSDDPSYFGAYVNENMVQCHKALGLSEADIVAMARNSFLGAFLPEEQRQQGLLRIDQYLALRHPGV